MATIITEASFLIQSVLTLSQLTNGDFFYLRKQAFIILLKFKQMLCIIFISVQDLQRSWTPHNNLGPDCFETYSDQRIFAFPGSSGTISVSNPGLPEPETRFLAIFYYPKPVFFQPTIPDIKKKTEIAVAFKYLYIW